MLSANLASTFLFDIDIKFPSLAGTDKMQTAGYSQRERMAK